MMKITPEYEKLLEEIKKLSEQIDAVSDAIEKMDNDGNRTKVAITGFIYAPDCEIGMSYSMGNSFLLNASIEEMKKDLDKKQEVGNLFGSLNNAFKEASVMSAMLGNDDDDKIIN